MAVGATQDVTAAARYRFHTESVLNMDPPQDAERTINDFHPMADWAAVTQAMSRGDTQAFEQFYRDCFDDMYRHARRFAGTAHADCLDLVHDGMLKAMRCIRPLADEGQVRAWTRSVMQSVCYDWLRSRAREQRRVDRYRDQANRTAGNQDISAETDARLAWLDQHIATLPAELRQLFHWRYRWGWTLQQIATRLGLKPGNIDGRLRRAIETIRTQVKEEFGDEV